MLLMRLMKRNILVYVRDRSTIFFSLLSMLIIIGLMVIFLGKMNADNVVNLLNEYGGIRNIEEDRVNAEHLVMVWSLAGIVVVNSVTITLTMVGIMVEDEASKKLQSFYVAPVNRTIFVMGYVLAAIIMGIIMCVLTVVLGEAYIIFSGGPLFTLEQIVKILLYIILNVFTSASMVFLVANLCHSMSAFGGLSTIIGTLVGFLAAIYLPIGSLSEGVQTILKCLPMIHGSSFLRNVLTEQILTDTFQNCPTEVIDRYKEYMGISVMFRNEVIPDGIKVAIMLISGIILIGISALIQRKRNVMSR